MRYIDCVPELRSVEESAMRHSALYEGLAVRNCRQAIVKKDSASDLLRKCAAASGIGADFLTIWHTILRGHPLAVGPPVSIIKEGRVGMAIYLIAAQRIAFDSTSMEFSLS